MAVSPKAAWAKSPPSDWATILLGHNTVRVENFPLLQSVPQAGHNLVETFCKSGVAKQLSLLVEFGLIARLSLLAQQAYGSSHE